MSSACTTGRDVDMWNATTTARAARDGISVREAIPRVVRDHPDLHQAYLAAVRAGDLPPTPSITYADPIATWNDRVQRAKASMTDPTKAVASVVKADPGLHRQYIEAVNAARQDPRCRR